MEFVKNNWVYAICIFIFVYAQVLIYLLDGEAESGIILTLIGGFGTNDILFGNYWSFITSNFTHTNILHIGFNLFAYFQISQIVRLFYSRSVEFVVYILGGIFGAIATYLYYNVLLDSAALSIGASASIFALLGLLIGGTVKNDRFGMSLNLNLQELINPIILVTLVSLIPGFNINTAAHAGGLLFGFLFGFFIPNTYASFGIWKIFYSKYIPLIRNVLIILTAISFVALILFNIELIFFLPI